MSLRARFFPVFSQRLYGSGGLPTKTGLFPAGKRPAFQSCLSNIVSFRGKFPHKKQIATAPVCRGSFVSGGSLPIAGLPIAIREDHIVQITRDELVQHRTYHAPFLLLNFLSVLYASSFPFASFKLDVFHNFIMVLFGSLHSAYCVFGRDTL